MAAVSSMPSGFGGQQQLATHAAVAVGAFALGALCRQRGAGSPAALPTQAPPQQRQTPPLLEDGHRNKNSRKLFKGEESAVRVICAGTIAEFQALIPTAVGRADRVLEVGVSGGGTSALLRLASAHVLAVDVERKDWAAAVAEAGGSLTLVDAVTDIAGLQALPIEPTVLFVDLSTILGHDPSFDGIALLRQLGRVFRATCGTIVVRSKSLRAHATQFIDPHALPEYTAPRPPAAALRAAPPLPRGGGAKVYCCVGVAEYRKTISWLVHGDDRVLEIGCQGGLTTDLISKHIRWVNGCEDAGSAEGARKLPGVLGVDVAKKSIAHANKNFPHTSFDVMDGWDAAGVVEMGKRREYEGTPKAKPAEAAAAAYFLLNGRFFATSSPKTCAV